MYAAVTAAIEQGTLQTHLPPAPVTDLDAGMRHLASLAGLLPGAGMCAVRGRSRTR
jgi:hypothetical protein